MKFIETLEYTNKTKPNFKLKLNGYILATWMLKFYPNVLINTAAYQLSYFIRCLKHEVVL